MKKCKKKDYIVVKDIQSVNIVYSSTVLTNTKVEEYDEEELKEYIKKNGSSKIRYILKNEPIEIETIINLKK